MACFHQNWKKLLLGSTIAFAFSVLATVIVYALLVGLQELFLRHGYYGVDIHKPSKPKVPEMGGIASSLVISIILVGIYFIIPVYVRGYVLTILSLFIYFSILGLIDDLTGLPGKLKLLGTVLGGVITLIIAKVTNTSFYVARPFLPFIGQIHGVNFLYPFLIIAAFTVTSNAFNMYDVYNGTLTFASTVVFAEIGFMILYANVATFAALTSIFSFIFAGASLGLFLVNKYPSRFFIGDTGSLSLGAAYSMIAIMGRVEVVAAIAIIPMLINGILSFGSVGKIFERHEVSLRPVLVENGLIRANPKKGAPMSLANFLTSRSPLTEKDIIMRYHIMTIVGATLSLVTFMLIPW
jgi:UDP-N-acetylglucosamine--dolichyl-phosphate N-acetylglucosaminephosphotransferase